MVRAVTLIPGATEFGYEPATVVQVLGPGQSAPENRHVTYAPSDVIASLDELQALAPNIETRGDGGRPGSATICAAGNAASARRSTTRRSQTYGAHLVGGRRRRAPARYLVSTIDGRAGLSAARRPTTASIDLIAELKARGLKVTLYPFVMMDIPAGNALADPWTGAASQPAYPWRGRITCDPAPGQAGSPDGTAAAATQVNAFFSGGPDSWNYRNMMLHYASLAASAGGVDAFLIGSELAALTRVRSASGVYPAVECAGDAGRRREGDRRRRHRSSPMAPTGPNTARMWSMQRRTKCAFRSMRCGRRRRSMRSASIITRRSPTGATTPMRSTARSATARIAPSYLAGNLDARRSL